MSNYEFPAGSDGLIVTNPETGEQWIFQDNAWQLYKGGVGFVQSVGDSMTGALTLPGDPTEDLHATTKAYVDSEIGAIDFSAAGVDSEAVAGIVDERIDSNAFVSKLGDSMFGFLTLDADPLDTMHAATKQYVDNLLGNSTDSEGGNFVNIAGDTMTGVLNAPRVDVDSSYGLNNGNLTADSAAAVDGWIPIWTDKTGTELESPRGVFANPDASIIFLTSKDGKFSLSQDGGETFSTPAYSNLYPSGNSGHGIACVTSSGKILVTKSKGMLVSDDVGQTWDRVDIPDGRYDVMDGNGYAFVKEISWDPNLIVAGTYGGYLNRSTDGGQTWYKNEEQRPLGNVNWCHFSEDGSGTMVALFEGRAYAVSEDDGVSWSTHIIGNEVIGTSRKTRAMHYSDGYWWIISDPYGRNEALGGGRVVSVWRTQNVKNESTWEEWSTALVGDDIAQTQIQNVELTPNGNLLISNKGGEYISLDFGLSWERLGESVSTLRMAGYVFTENYTFRAHYNDGATMPVAYTDAVDDPTQHLYWNLRRIVTRRDLKEILDGLGQTGGNPDYDLWYVRTDGDTMTGNLSIPAPVNTDHAVNVEYMKTITDPLDSAKVSKLGDSMEGDLSLFQQPTKPMHATPKSYVDKVVFDALNGADSAGDSANSLSALFVLKGGDSMSGALALSGAPIEDRHAATKAYVDSEIVAAIEAIEPDDLGVDSEAIAAIIDERIDSTSFVSIAGDTMTGRLTLSDVPVDSMHAATKYYVDNLLARDDGQTIDSAFDSIQEITDKLDSDLEDLVDDIAELEDTKVSRSGDSMTGHLTLAGDPIEPFHAATRQFVLAQVGDSSVALDSDEINAIIDARIDSADFVAISGGTMTGKLVLSEAPTDSMDAATKYYVDEKLGNLGDISVDSSLDSIQDIVENIDSVVDDLVTEIDTKVDKSGDSMSGFLKLHADPTDSMHAATKYYVDEAIGDLGGITVDSGFDSLEGVIDIIEDVLDTKVEKSGDSMQGFLKLHADPTDSLHAATKQYVDTLDLSDTYSNVVTVINTNEDVWNSNGVGGPTGAPVESPDGKEGWYWVSPGTAGTEKSIGWRLFNNNSGPQAFTVEDVDYIYMLVDLKATGDVYFNLYTAGLNPAPSAFKSRFNFAINGTHSSTGTYLLWAKMPGSTVAEADVKVHQNFPRIELPYIPAFSSGDLNVTEEVKSLNITTSTSVGAGDVEFTLKTAGYKVNTGLISSFFPIVMPDDLADPFDSDKAIGVIDERIDSNDFVSLAGDSMTGFLSLHSNPTDPMHAATMAYVTAAIIDAVDSNTGSITVDSGMILSTFVEVAGDSMTGTLSLASDPLAPMQAATKQYVDTQVAGVASDVGLDSAEVNQLITDAGLVQKSGDIMTGALILNTNDPQVANQAASKQFVEDQDAALRADLARFILDSGDVNDLIDERVDLDPFLEKSGGTMTGDLTLAQDPSSALHAATMQYVDTEITAAVNAIDIPEAGTDSATVNDLIDARIDSSEFMTLQGNQEIPQTTAWKLRGQKGDGTKKTFLSADADGETFHIYNLAEPSDAKHAATKNYVDSEIAAAIGGGGGTDYVSTTGDTMTGELVLEGGIKVGPQGDRAVVKFDVDGVVRELEAKEGEIANLDGWIKNTTTMSGASDIAFGHGKYCAVTTSGNKRIWVSTDGNSWAALGQSVPSNNPFNSKQLMSVNFANNMFLITANSNKFYVSVGTTMQNWDEVSVSLGATWVDAAYGPGKGWVAVSNSGQAMRGSADGQTWVSTSIPNRQFEAVTYGGGKFVAVASNGVSRAFWSADGNIWNTVAMSDTSLNNNAWTDVHYANGRFVAVAKSSSGNQKRFMYSTDGEEWTGVADSQLQPWSSITYGSGYFMAVANGTSKAVFSRNGTVWTPSQGTNGSWKGVATNGDGRFVAVDGSSSSSAIQYLDAGNAGDVEQAGLYYEGVLLASKTNLEPLFNKVNELEDEIANVELDKGLVTADSAVTMFLTREGGGSFLDPIYTAEGPTSSWTIQPAFDADAAHETFRVRHSNQSSNAFEVTAGGQVSVGIHHVVVGERDVAHKLYVDANMPSEINDLDNVNATPEIGDTLVWNGSAWVAQTPSAGGASVAYQDLAPDGAENGDLWFNTNSLKLSVYHGNAWVQIGA